MTVTAHAAKVQRDVDLYLHTTFIAESEDVSLKTCTNSSVLMDCGHMTGCILCGFQLYQVVGSMSQDPPALRVCKGVSSGSNPTKAFGLAVEGWCTLRKEFGLPEKQV